MITINEILKQHPEYGDLPFGFCNSNGDTHFVEEGNTFLFVGEFTDEEGEYGDKNKVYKTLLLTDD